MKLIPFQAVMPKMALITSAQSFFGTVKHQYPEYVKSGFFSKDAQESIYLYQIDSPVGSYTGIVACTDIEDFLQGRVLKHEHTLAAKEQQMLHVFLQNKAMVKPILLGYHGDQKLTKWMADYMSSTKPLQVVHFEETNEYHKIWGVSEGSAVALIKDTFKVQVGHCFIADGHHRSSTAVALFQNEEHPLGEEASKGILTIYIPFDQLSIYDYNRCLEVLRDISAVELIVRLSRYCKIKPLAKVRKPKRKHEFTMIVAGQCYLLKWKKAVIKRATGMVVLDADLLNQYLIQGICNIQNVREDHRITYVDGVSGVPGMLSEVSKSKYRVGVFLYPVSADELQTIAVNGDTLPPKSTWFEPRIKNGMLVKEL